jgi:hypothetical protein
MASKQIHVDLDLLQNALRNALADPVASDPVTPANGQVWYNTSTGTFKVRASGVTLVLGRLDQISAPTSSVAMNSQRLTGLADPADPQDAATKNYVDNAIAGLDPKDSVRCATTASITLSGTQTIDGIALTGGERVLVKNQATASQNGIYVVAGGAWSRATDANAWNELISAFVWVEQGTTNADTGWVCTVDAGGSLGTTDVTFVQFNGGQAYLGGSGLTLTGNTFDVNVDGSTIEINADVLRVKDLGITGAKLAANTVTLAKIQTITQDRILGRVSTGTGDAEQLTAAQVKTMLGIKDTYAADIGNASATAITVTQNLGTYDVVVEVFRNSGNRDTIECLVRRSSTNAVVCEFNVAPGTNEYRVVVRA